MPHYLLSPESMFSHVRIIGVLSRTMTLGLETTDTSRTSVRVRGIENIKPFLDTFHKFGHTELDTARIYCLGDTETVNFPTLFTKEIISHHLLYVIVVANSLFFPFATNKRLWVSCPQTISRLLPKCGLPSLVPMDLSISAESSASHWRR
jgi:hypothetical protein